MKGIFKSSKKGESGSDNAPPPQTGKTGESSSGPAEDAAPKRKKGFGLFKKLFGRSSRPHETPGYNSPYGTQSVDAAGDLRILKDPQLLYKSQLELHLDETNQYIILFDLHDLTIGTTYNSIHDLHITRVSKTQIRAVGPDFEETITLPSNRTSKIITKPPTELMEQPVAGRKASSPSAFLDGASAAAYQDAASPSKEVKSPQHNTGRKFSEPILSIPPNIDKGQQPLNRIETVAEERETNASGAKTSGPGSATPSTAVKEAEKAPPVLPTKMRSASSAAKTSATPVSPTTDEAEKAPPVLPTKTRSASNATKTSATPTSPVIDESQKTVPILTTKPRSASNATKTSATPVSPVIDEPEKTVPIVPTKPRSPSIAANEKSQNSSKSEAPHDSQQKPKASPSSEHTERKADISEKRNEDLEPQTTTEILVAVPQGNPQDGGTASDGTEQLDSEGRPCRSSTVVVGSVDIVVKIEQEEENLLEKVKDTTQLDALTRGRPRANTRRLPTRKGIESRTTQEDELVIPEKDSFTVPEASAAPIRGPGFAIPSGGFQLPPPVARPTAGDGSESNGLAARNSASRRSFAGPSPMGGPMPMFNPAEAKLRKAGGDSAQPKAEAPETKQIDFRDVLKKKNPNA